jgi:hypothetical protein
MEQHALVDLRDLEQVADIHSRQPNQVAKRDHRTLVVRERIHGVEETLP